MSKTNEIKIVHTHRVRYFEPGFWEVVEDWECAGDITTVRAAYTLDGIFLDDFKTVYRMTRNGMVPITHSLGYSPAAGLWYGWSHRGMHGFKRRRDAERFARRVV